MIKVTVWNEGLHEQKSPEIAAVYPKGIHGCIKDFLDTDEEFVVRTATLSDEECGLTDEVLNDTDVMLWWGHMAHDRVPDEIVEKVYNRVLNGMGIIILHSGHKSKIFMRLMGSTANLRWRDGDRERIWTVNPAHPIAQGIPEYFTLDKEEMYGERFDIPEPQELVFMGWFSGGEVFRSGCCWQKGLGKVFYFQPGHEGNPTFHNKYIQRIINNAVHWANPLMGVTESKGCPHAQVSPEEEYKKGE